MLAHNSEDIFNHNNAPEMVKELSIINERVAHTPVYFKSEIIIAYLKDHCIKSDWIAANPELVKIMLSNRFATKHIESLFEISRMKQEYRCDFENYIKKQLLN